MSRTGAVTPADRDPIAQLEERLHALGVKRGRAWGEDRP